MLIKKEDQEKEKILEREKEKELKKTVRTPTNNNGHKNILISNNNKVNKQNLNNMLKSTTINPKKKEAKPENINIKQALDVKTERPHKKISGPTGNLNASWNLTMKGDKNGKKEESKVNKLNQKSPIKLKKKNSKTPKNNMSKKNLFDVTKSKEIDKEFLSSLTGNLQSLISNIEVIEKAGKKTNDQVQVGK